MKKKKTNNAKPVEENNQLPKIEQLERLISYKFQTQGSERQKLLEPLITLSDFAEKRKDLAKEGDVLALGIIKHYLQLAGVQQGTTEFEEACKYLRSNKVFAYMYSRIFLTDPDLSQLPFNEKRAHTRGTYFEALLGIIELDAMQAEKSRGAKQTTAKIAGYYAVRNFLFAQLDGMLQQELEKKVGEINPHAKVHYDCKEARNKGTAFVNAQVFIPTRKEGEKTFNADGLNEESAKNHAATLALADLLAQIERSRGATQNRRRGRR